MSVIIDIADAIVAHLKDADPGSTYIAERSYKPFFELAELSGLHVTVVPGSIEATKVSRAQVKREYKIQIGIQKKLGEGKYDAELDSLMTMVEAIDDSIQNESQYGTAVWVSSENDPPYAPDHLRDMRLFTSLLTITLMAMR